MHNLTGPSYVLS